MRSLVLDTELPPTQWKNPTTTNKKEINKDQPTKNKQSHKQTKIPNSNTLEVKCFTFGFGTWMSECEEQQWITINCNSDKRKAVASIVHSISRLLNQFFFGLVFFNIFLPICVSSEYLWLEKVPVSSVVSIWSHSNRCLKWLRKGVTHTICWIFPGIFSLDLSKYCTKECSFIGLQTKTYI